MFGRACPRMKLSAFLLLAASLLVPPAANAGDAIRGNDAPRSAATPRDDTDALLLQVVTRTWEEGGAIRSVRLQSADVTVVPLPAGEFVVGLDAQMPVERRFSHVRERRTWAVGVASGPGSTRVLMPRVAEVPWGDAYCMDVSCAPQWRHTVEWPTLDRDAFDAAVHAFVRSDAPRPLRMAALECFDADAKPCFRFVTEHELELAVQDDRRGERRYRVRFVSAPRS